MELFKSALPSADTRSRFRLLPSSIFIVARSFFRGFIDIGLRLHLYTWICDGLFVGFHIPPLRTLRLSNTKSNQKFSADLCLPPPDDTHRCHGFLIQAFKDTSDSGLYGFICWFS